MEEFKQEKGKKKKKGSFILVLFILLAFGLGYALIQTTLNITGQCKS